MIELRGDALLFSFPGVHPEARVSVEFQRTLRIPDDDRSYPLPPGLGRFPLRHVDDHADRVPASWLRRGGVMLPMYQSEAMWLNFRSVEGYPFAVKVATGKVSAVTGERWSDGLGGDPQDYLVVPTQPWLDGYVVEKGTIRQFVAMPLGAGYTAEEQLTGEAEHGGLQIEVYPMKRRVWERMQRSRPRTDPWMVADLCEPMASYAPEMGLAPGGRMRQEVYDDPHGLAAWDTTVSSRCFVHLTNSLAWRAITGREPPTVPFTAAEYARAGLPWFEYYAEDRRALEATEALRRLKGIARLGREKEDAPLPENEPVAPANVVKLREGLRSGQVREGVF